MPDPRTVELIHARIDGELADGELGELRSRLASDPGAEELQGQLEELDSALRAIPMEEPPAELAADVMTAVRAAMRERSQAAPVRFDRRARRRSLFARAGLGLAAAIALVFAFVPSLRESLDDRNAVGTMGSHPEAASDERQFAIQGERIRGSIGVVARDEQIVLSIRFDDDASRTVRVAFDATRYALQMPSPASPEAVTSSAGFFSVEPDGREARIVLLPRDAVGSGRVSLSIVQEGDFYETTIDLDR